jgi:hypothetical protein
LGDQSALWQTRNSSRFYTINSSAGQGRSAAAVFESADGKRFAIASANDPAAADETSLRLGPGATILAVQPQWSFPAKIWVEADPEF